MIFQQPIRGSDVARNRQSGRNLDWRQAPREGAGATAETRSGSRAPCNGTAMSALSASPSNNSLPSHPLTLSLPRAVLRTTRVSGVAVGFTTTFQTIGFRLFGHAGRLTCKQQMVALVVPRRGIRKRRRSHLVVKLETGSLASARDSPASDINPQILFPLIGVRSSG